MLRRACSRVQVLPFKQPEVLAKPEFCGNRVALMGLLCKEVRRPEHRPVAGVAMSTMLVPMLPMPTLPAQPSSTPCTLICVDFWGDLANIALAHLAPGHHIFVSGTLNLIPCTNAFRVCAHVVKFVLDDSPFDRNNTHPGTLQALATDDASRWLAYFHTPSEWRDYRSLKMSAFPDFKHKYTGVSLCVSASSTPEWVKARLAQQPKISTPSHDILHPSAGENFTP